MAESVTPITIALASKPFSHSAMALADFGRVWGAPENGGRIGALCRPGKEIVPIDPGKGEYELRGPRQNVIDTSTQGVYIYPPDAISPSCGAVSLEIFSEKDPNTPITQAVETGTVERVWSDFEPYRKGKNK